MKGVRREDLLSLRGNGKGKRKPRDRIYDAALIMIWVVLTRMKNLLDQPWVVRSGLILGAVELVDLQPRKV